MRKKFLQCLKSTKEPSHHHHHHRIRWNEFRSDLRRIKFHSSRIFPIGKPWKYKSLRRPEREPLSDYVLGGLKKCESSIKCGFIFYYSWKKINKFECFCWILFKKIAYFFKNLPSNLLENQRNSSRTWLIVYINPPHHEINFFHRVEKTSELRFFF